MSEKVVPLFPSDSNESPDVDPLGEQPPSPSNGGGKGGPPVDNETQRYLDAKVDATRAQNDARFSEVISAISTLSTRIEDLPSAKSQLVAIVTTGAAIFLGLIAVLAFAGDRFDGGMSASTDGAVAKEIITQQSKDIQKLIDAQAVENQKMLEALVDHHEGQKGFEAPE